MEMVMSTKFGAPASVRDRPQALGSSLAATVKTWWVAYLARRVERAAIMQLHAMSDRQLQDIGLPRSDIEWAVRGELDHRPLTDHY
jgi:uncharacterized protein YjiS (DUF1127 family)